MTPETDTDELKRKFWNSLAGSPMVFLQLDADPSTAVPMTAQLDKDANSKVWFFTRKGHPLSALGPATATFAGKDHDIFARISGNLAVETSRERLEKQWSSVAEAWFPAGKDDPELLMLRYDLGHAEIWNSDLGFIDNIKMLLGFDTRDEAKKEHAETAL